MKKLPFRYGLVIGLSLSLLWSCAIPINIDSFESSDRYLREQLLPNIQVDSQLVSDTTSYK